MSVFARRAWYAALVFLTAVTGALCAQSTKAAPPTPLDVKKVELGEPPWNAQWDQIVEKAVPPAMLSRQVPEEVRRFCPRFYEMSQTNMRAFWAYFFQALAGVEAGLQPDTVAPHGIRERKIGMARHSEGLLQLAYEDRERYGCDFSRSRDRGLGADSPERSILRPRNNLECGVKILDNQIIGHHRPLLTRWSYWSPLRPGEPSEIHFLKQMTNPPAACGLPRESTISKSATTKTVQEDAMQGVAPK
ncbi:MAG: hypothetical protein WA532_15265 [Candidatus Korobacteraceae bacterium]